MMDQNGQNAQVEKAGTGFAEFIALTAALSAITAMSIDIMLPALPAIGQELGVTTDNDRQLVIVVFTLVFGVAQLFFGPLSDRFGRRPIIQGGILLYVLGSVAAAFSTDFTMLLLCRSAQGIGAAALRVVAMAVVRDCFAGAAMGRVLSISFTVFMIVPIAAPFFGQIITLGFGWRAVFAALAIASAVIATWLILRLKETLDPADRRGISVSSLASGFVEIVTNRVAAGYTVVMSATVVALFGYITSVQQIYGELYALGPWFPAAFAATALGMALVGIFAPRIVRHFGMRPVIHGSLVLFCLSGFALFAWSMVELPPFIVTFVLISAAMISFGVMQSQAGAVAMEPLGHVAGIASSLIGVVTTVVGAAGGGLIGAAYDGTIVPMALSFFMGGVISLLAVAWTERGKLFVGA